VKLQGNILSVQSSKELAIVPSLICTDLCNLEQSVKEMESLGCKMIHVDIIDGNFSPSMPIGLETIKQVRQKTSMDFDVHLMVLNNEFFIRQMIDIGASRICFHVENERHTSQLLTQIKANGIEAGVALSPATPVCFLDYIIEQCDFVLLMGINPGYASFSGEEKVSYIRRKIEDCSELIRKYQLKTTITIDGRVSFDDLLPYAQAGASTFVGGSSSLFHPPMTFEENWNKANKILSQIKEQKIS
jgi:ribulose-phosphate 3-epimerase